MREYSLYQAGANEARIEILEFLYNSGRLTEFPTFRECVVEILAQALNDRDLAEAIADEYNIN